MLYKQRFKVLEILHIKLLFFISKKTVGLHF